MREMKAANAAAAAAAAAAASAPASAPLSPSDTAYSTKPASVSPSQKMTSFGGRSASPSRMEVPSSFVYCHSNDARVSSMPEGMDSESAGQFTSLLSHFFSFINI